MKFCSLIKSSRLKCGDYIGNDPEISSVHYSTGDIQPGGLFVAVKGFSADGHDYIDDAVKKGAVAVIAEKTVDTKAALCTVEDSRKALALISAGFYENPSDKASLIGVTGTNGKTTVTYLLENILKEAGKNPGVIGTINYRYNGEVYPNPMTTPESMDLQRIMAEMTKCGVSHIIMEVSSHAVDLSRIEGTRFDVGIFTNLSQDHLDYHETMESYWQCKERFFTDHLFGPDKKESAAAVVNTDDEHGRILASKLGKNTITTGQTKGCSIKATDSQFNIKGIKGRVHTDKGTINIVSDAVGNHNLENILSAAGGALALGLPVSAVDMGIRKFTVPGRLERIENNINRNVFVDYAHTPDALENVLRTLKSVNSGRIICVVGCGGDRDRTKRPLMGKIASDYSDLTIITSDNPRTEDPDTIISDILEGIESGGSKKYMTDALSANFHDKGYTVEPDRRKAIYLSVSASSSGDTILIAGKGHETYQIIGTTTISFDDREEAGKALKHHE